MKETTTKVGTQQEWNAHDSVVLLLNKRSKSREGDPQLVKIDVLQYFRETAMVVAEQKTVALGGRRGKCVDRDGVADHFTDACVGVLKFHVHDFSFLGVWRNGSAVDSSSKGCVFESRYPQFLYCLCQIGYKEYDNSRYGS